MKRLFKQFSFPGGIPSHDAPETPGSINEGGELGYSLVHAYGAVFDNPDLIACCVIGDGEAETGALATSWHSNKFLESGARRRGAADSASERLQDRRPHGAGAHSARGADRTVARLRLSAVFRRRPRAGADASDHGRDARLRSSERSSRFRKTRARTASASALLWPMIVLDSPKGWTGPKVVDGLQVEGTFRAHQVPLAELAAKPEHLQDARRMDEELPARGAVRSRRHA